MGLGAVVVSWYIWRLRLFEHENTHVGPLAYKKKSEFSLMSSVLHFVLSSVASMGFMANGLMSGSILCGFMLVARVFILAVAFCGYTGCYFSGEGKVPWYLRPCIRQRPSGIERVYSAVKSSNGSKIAVGIILGRGEVRPAVAVEPVVIILMKIANQVGLRYRY